MGLELNVYKTVRSLRSYRFITLTLVWSWIIGPALAYFITNILPLSAPHAAGLLLFGLAPTSPMLPILIRKFMAVAGEAYKDGVIDSSSFFAKQCENFLSL